MKPKIKEGEVICNKCNGTGYDEKEVFICNKCLGEGKLDWVSNVVPNTEKLSSGHLIRIRQAVTSLQNISETCFPDINSACEISREYLDTLKMNGTIYDYKLEIDPIKKNHYRIYMSPSRTIEVVRVEFEFNKKENICGK